MSRSVTSSVICVYAPHFFYYIPFLQLIPRVVTVIFSQSGSGSAFWAISKDGQNCLFEYSVPCNSLRLRDSIPPVMWRYISRAAIFLYSVTTSGLGPSLGLWPYLVLRPYLFFYTPVLERVLHLGTFSNYFVQIHSGKIGQSIFKVYLDTVSCPSLHSR